MQHADWVQGPNQYQQNQQANGNISTKDAQANGAPSGARKRRPRTVPASYTSTSGGSGKRASFSGTLPDGEYICNDVEYLAFSASVCLFSITMQFW